MASIDIDISELTAPISDENPAGVDLREDSGRGGDFRTVKDAREEARRIERQADLDGEEPTQAMTHWRTVRSLSQNILREQSKDLEVVANLIEALARTDGFAGLQAGFQLARELVENYWDQLYPAPDEDGLATRVLPLARLNGDGAEGLLLGPILRIPITQGDSAGPYALWQQRQANDLARYSDREREERIARGAVTPELFARAAAETDTEFYRELLQHIAGAQREFEALGQALDEKCGDDPSASPPTSAIREALDDCLAAVREISRDRFPDEPLLESVNGEATGGGKSAPGAVANRLETREDAFRVLIGVAEFFEGKDPHCLLAAQIRKVVRLGRMTPAEYFSELIQDRAARDELFKLVGIKAPEGSDE